jgi:hypothetical protein
MICIFPPGQGEQTFGKSVMNIRVGRNGFGANCCTQARCRRWHRNPSIGLILCREHNRVVVEYALRGVDTPIGVARYQLMLADDLPAQLADSLPSP